ncbi:hypothetical protein LXN10_04640 [Arcobacter sp. KX21116]|uniref:hypothetical protein n=1 Tax=Arcobacter iocasae TaxID=2906515 RepID=UPI0035D3FF42
MNNELPSSLYKYQAIKNINNLSEDRSIQNLFNRQIIFSSRKNFNDPFDSKIDLIFPTLTEIKMLRKKLYQNKKKK